ncbi:MAG: glycosyltransferase, partial [Actinomycetota bacterium]
MTHARTSVAYLLKAFPLLSETFISSEIRRIEGSGVAIRIFVIKPRDEREHHPVVDRIRARPSYLPPTRRLSEVSRTWWLITNVPPFVPSLFRTARRHPAGVLRAVSWALRESITARRSAWSWPKISYIRDLLLAVALADRVLKCGDVGHLHAHFAHETTTIAWLTSLITDLPFSFTAHAKDIYSQRINPEDLLRRKLSAASFVVTCTDANRKHLGEMANGTPIHRIYHGLNDDFSTFLEGRPPPAVETEVLRLLTVGRLVAKKGFDILVEACGVLHERNIEFGAEIVGEDDDIGDGIRVGDDLRSRIAGLGLEERVRLVGQLGQAEVYERYRASGVFCLPC